MIVINSEFANDKKLVQKRGNARRGVKAIKPARLTRWADPRLKPHKVKGRIYYTYCRGTDKEIYLGSADTILRAVLLVNKLPKKEAPIYETNPEYIS